MRQIKVIFLSVLFLSLLVLCFSLLIPNHSKVSRAINIKKPKGAIKKEILHLEQWSKWHPFLKKQSRISTLSFEKDKNQLSIDNYKFSIINESDSSIDFLAVNPKGEKMNSTIVIYNYGDSCAVNWYSEVHVNSYPWEKFKTIFYDNMYGPALDSNLVALKNYLESE